VRTINTGHEAEMAAHEEYDGYDYAKACAESIERVAKATADRQDSFAELLRKK